MEIMECITHPFNALKSYIFVDIIAFYDGKWLLSKHKERATWEAQGGHIEAGETTLEAAKRELYEESGAIDFVLEPLCDYWVSGYLNGAKMQGNGQVFLAKVHSLGKIPYESEMEKICLFDSLPRNLTYLQITSKLLPIVQEKLQCKEFRSWHKCLVL